MGRIQSSVGLVTGVQIDSTVDQLMKLNAIPRDRLLTRITSMQREQTALTDLMTQVVGLQLTTDRLGQTTLYSATTVSSSDTKAITARNTGSPKVGTYSFVPVRLAQNQQQTSSLLASADQQLQAGEVVIHTGGFLDNSLSLDQLNAGQGVARGSIRIIDRSGVAQTIDLRFAQTANDVVEAINSNDRLSVVASLEGDRFVLKDVSGSSVANLSVSEVGGGRTAADLGLVQISTSASTAQGTSLVSLSAATPLRTLLDGRGIELPKTGAALRFDLRNGTSIELTSSLASDKASLGQLIDEINAAGEGKLTARIANDGTSLNIEDLTSGSASFAISSPAGTLAQQLGWDGAAVGGLIEGDQLVSGLSDTLLSSLAGGQGLGELGQLSITDRSGASATVDLSAAKTLGDVITAIKAASVSVTAQLNQTKTGLQIIDNSGSTSQALTIANADATNAASKLQIEASVEAVSIDSGSLSKQFVSRNTLLKDWNQGAGLSLGSIELIDSTGVKSAINFNSLKPKSIGEVLDAINAASVGIEAKINQTGDGILLVDTAGGIGALSVADIGSGKTASQLGIAGTGSEQTLDQVTTQVLDGSRTIRITTTNQTTVAELAEQINGLANGPINTSLLNVGSEAGVRLLVNSNQAGQRGRVAISGSVGLSFSETTQARDALIAFGASDQGGGILVSSSSNKFRDVIEDVEISIVSTSTSPITVSISENTDSISKQINTFVDQYNKLRTKYEELTAFDSTKNTVGVLFGKGAALRVDLSYGRFLSGALRGAGPITSLNQVGVRLNDQGKLEFDQSKFEAAIASDPTAVQQFFTDENNGFSVKSKALADSLAGVDNGALLNGSNALQSKIEQTSKRVDSMNVRLDKQRERLLRQFYSMESAVAKLQQNLTALNQLQIIPPLGSRNS
jgi:flagellar hook-associated protein 2